MATTKAQPGLRERKKQRTRQTIVEVATGLFEAQGYQETTLVQIAEQADVSPSTFFNYFPTKVDIVFCLWDSVIESAQRRIAGRPDGEQAIPAISAWLTEELPSVEQPYNEAARRIPAIIASVPELRAEERLRLARLEDVFADGFGRDLGEPADGVRPRVLAAMAIRGMNEAWAAWFAKHAADADFQLVEALEVKAAHVVKLLETGLVLVSLLPRPPEAAPVH